MKRAHGQLQVAFLFHGHEYRVRLSRLGFNLWRQIYCPASKVEHLELANEEMEMSDVPTCHDMSRLDSCCTLPYVAMSTAPKQRCEAPLQQHNLTQAAEHRGQGAHLFRHLPTSSNSTWRKCHSHVTRMSLAYH